MTSERVTRTELGMKTRREDPVLAQQDRIAIQASKDLDVLADGDDLGCPDEDAFAVLKTVLPVDLRDRGMDLPAVAVAVNRDVEKS